MPDYYKTLGVDRKASDEEIKRAYRKLLLNFVKEIFHSLPTIDYGGKL